MHNHYAITLPDQTILTMFIGKPNPALDTLLAENQAFSYAYLTAFNPELTTLTPEKNQIRQDSLLNELDIRGYHYLAGSSFPEDGAWLPEECAFVFDLPRSVTSELCQKFNQDAAVIGELGDTPKLFFTNPALSSDFMQLVQNCLTA